MDMQKLYQAVSDTILEQLQAGCLPWRRDWNATPGANIPHNVASQRPYSGTNTLLLWMMAQRKSWPTLQFLTDKQAKDLNASVRLGEKVTMIVFVKMLQVPDRKDEKIIRLVPMLRARYVFNVSQVDGLPEAVTNPATKPPRNKDCRADYQDAEAFLTSTGADIREGAGNPAYVPSGDYITLPKFGDFNNADAFYGAAFHECGHWTGHKSRLNRELRGRFSDAHAYAAEELVAELTAAFLCAEFSLAGDMRHAGYIQHWIALLEHDAKAFFTAASKAQAAADYLRQLAIAGPAVAA
jgi:antirestriction protein ArdC